MWHIREPLFEALILGRGGQGWNFKYTTWLELANKFKLSDQPCFMGEIHGFLNLMADSIWWVIILQPSQEGWGGREDILSFQVFTYYFHNPKLGVGRFILAFGRKCAAVQRKILRKVGNQLASDPRTSHPMVRERGTSAEYIPDSGIGFSR